MLYIVKPHKPTHTIIVSQHRPAPFHVYGLCYHWTSMFVQYMYMVSSKVHFDEINVFNITTSQTQMSITAITITCIHVYCMPHSGFTCISIFTTTKKVVSLKKRPSFIVHTLWIKSTNVLMPQWSCRGRVHTECITIHDCWQLLACK